MAVQLILEFLEGALATLLLAAIVAMIEMRYKLRLLKRRKSKDLVTRNLVTS
jgi:hypothetical protein